VFFARASFHPFQAHAITQIARTPVGTLPCPCRFFTCWPAVNQPLSRRIVSSFFRSVWCPFIFLSPRRYASSPTRASTSTSSHPFIRIASFPPSCLEYTSLLDSLSLLSCLEIYMPPLYFFPSITPSPCLPVFHRSFPLRDRKTSYLAGGAGFQSPIQPP